MNIQRLSSQGVLLNYIGKLSILSPSRRCINHKRVMCVGQRHVYLCVFIRRQNMNSMCELSASVLGLTTPLYDCIPYTHIENAIEINRVQ